MDLKLIDFGCACTTLKEYWRVNTSDVSSDKELKDKCYLQEIQKILKICKSFMMINFGNNPTQQSNDQVKQQLKENYPEILAIICYVNNETNI